MARYRVAFDGEYREDFDDEQAALAWATEVAETGRLAYVVRWSLFRQKLIAVLPESESETGRSLWRNRFVGIGGPPTG